MSIDIRTIKESACGHDTEGRSKSISILGAHNYKSNSEMQEPEVIAEFSSLEPVVSIAIGGEITWISLKFLSDKSSDLSLFFRTLERYLEEVDKATEEKNPVAFLSLIPIEFSGQYYINAVHPIMWAVEPESIGTEFRILRIAFFSENIAFLESSLEDDFFAEALEIAKQENDPDNYMPRRQEYGKSERDEEFTDSDRFFADFNESKKQYDYDYDYDEEDEEDEDDEENSIPYIYHN